MHDSAYEFLTRVASALSTPGRVVELGSRDVNGSPRALFPAPDYVGVDLDAGPGVDVVADAADWSPPDGTPFDLVLCTEVLEHCAQAADLCANAHRLLRAGGAFVVTCASPLREPHGKDGEALPAGEYYRGVSRGDLAGWLTAAGFELLLFDPAAPEEDVYAVAFKGRAGA